MKSSLLSHVALARNTSCHVCCATFGNSSACFQLAQLVERVAPRNGTHCFEPPLNGLQLRLHVGALPRTSLSLLDGGALLSAGFFNCCDQLAFTGNIPGIARRFGFLRQTLLERHSLLQEPFGGKTLLARVALCLV